MKVDVKFGEQSKQFGVKLEETEECFNPNFNSVITVTGGSNPVIKKLTITENGTYTAPYNVDGYSPVTVNVPIPEGYIVPSGLKEINENGTYDVTEYSHVNVNVVGGDEANALEDAVLDGTLTGEYANDRVTTIRQYALYQQYSLERVRMNSVKTVPVYGFGHCNSLKHAEFASATSIAAAAFLMCFRLTALVLRSQSVVSLANVNAFSSCYHFYGNSNPTYNPNGDKDGYVYVPASLVDTYKTATNWSTMADRIRAIEDYPDITGG